MISFLRQYEETVGSFGLMPFLLCMMHFVVYGMVVPKDSWGLFMLVFIIGSLGSIACVIRFSQLMSSKDGTIKEYEEGLMRLGQFVLRCCPDEAQGSEEWKESRKVWQRAVCVFNFFKNKNERLERENRALCEERVRIVKENEKLKLKEKEKTFSQTSTSIADLNMEK